MEAKDVVLTIEGGYVVKIKGGDTPSEPPDPNESPKKVKLEQTTALGTGCPAWIWIEGRRYRI